MYIFFPTKASTIVSVDILGDPGADSGGEEKSKRAEKYGTKKSKERREEPLGTMSYQTSSKRSPPSWLLIGARKLLCFSAQSEAKTAATVLGPWVSEDVPLKEVKPSSVRYMRKFLTFVTCFRQ